MDKQSIVVDGVNYIRADTAPASKDGLPFVVVRSYGAGVFAGYLVEREDKVQRVKLDGCIRLWRWTGCSLSQVAVDGVSGAGENKFSVRIDGHEILQVIEIIPCTEKARKALEGVAPWKL